MGNSKSRKMRVTEINSENTKPEVSRERINSLKTDIPDAANDSGNLKAGGGIIDDDNASSASTVEVLDQK